MATHLKSQNSTHVGVDVGKDKLDFHIYERGLHWQCNNTPEGIRTVLYIAMLNAIQYNDRFGAFYRSLVAKGKHKKVATTACMRKMMTILNTMVRDGAHNKRNHLI